MDNESNTNLRQDKGNIELKSDNEIGIENKTSELRKLRNELAELQEVAESTKKFGGDNPLTSLGKFSEKDDNNNSYLNVSRGSDSNRIDKSSTNFNQENENSNRTIKSRIDENQRSRTSDREDRQRVSGQSTELQRKNNRDAEFGGDQPQQNGKGGFHSYAYYNQSNPKTEMSFQFYLRNGDPTDFINYQRRGGTNPNSKKTCCGKCEKHYNRISIIATLVGYFCGFLALFLPNKKQTVSCQDKKDMIVDCDCSNTNTLFQLGFFGSGIFLMIFYLFIYKIKKCCCENKI